MVNIIMQKINSLDIATSEYASVLMHLSHPPERINVLGRLPSARKVTVAIIGTRRPTSYGKEVTFDLAYKLASKGVIIVSGLAFGIDAIAHRAALEANGTTVAVLANGLDSVYPVSHTRLAKDIVEKGGAIISEYPEGRRAYKNQFLERNRLISGLADAVVVVEASERSGTLSTVNHALDQNKEVFAVPGPITSPMSKGPNKFIYQGAHPVLSAETILEAIAPELLNIQASVMIKNTTEALIFDLVRRGISDDITLLKQSHLSVAEFSSAITMLEINAYIRKKGDHWLPL